MSLADAPVETTVRITAAGSCSECAVKYGSVGVASGRHARVLARYPHAGPRFVEVELDGERLVTLPISYAREVSVDPAAALTACLPTCPICTTV